MIAIELNDISPVPPFEQVREQLERLVTSGAVPAGTRLPTVRQLASDLSLAPNTVARAYRELEAAGLLETHGRRGTIVGKVVVSESTRNRMIIDAARRFHDEVLLVGGTMDDAVRALRSIARGVVPLGGGSRRMDNADELA
ncbi:MAG: GntR family transcriptional regulator [Acidimicrobiales bacterium]